MVNYNGQSAINRTLISITLIWIMSMGFAFILFILPEDPISQLRDVLSNICTLVFNSKDFAAEDGSVEMKESSEMII